MGLDIVFNRKAAMKAGMEVSLQRNGTDEQIACALMDTDNDQDGYVEYLQRTEELVQIPGTDWWLSNGGDEEDIIVRANMWGDSYAPLTAWLQKHNILWSSF